MKKLLLLPIILLLSGCSAASYLNNIPNTEFESFEYRRGGNVSSAFVKATDGKVSSEGTTIGNVEIAVEYPFFNAGLRIKGYKRSKEGYGF